MKGFSILDPVPVATGGEGAQRYRVHRSLLITRDEQGLTVSCGFSTVWYYDMGAGFFTATLPRISPEEARIAPDYVYCSRGVYATLDWRPVTVVHALSSGNDGQFSLVVDFDPESECWSVREGRRTDGFVVYGDLTDVVTHHGGETP